jgi:hypothetical protein
MSIIFQHLYSQNSNARVFGSIHKGNAPGKRVRQQPGIRIEKEKVVSFGTRRALIGSCGKSAVRLIANNV